MSQSMNESMDASRAAQSGAGDLPRSRSADRADAVTVVSEARGGVQAAASGLEGVTVARTALGRVDGGGGELILCGERLADFVARHRFESAVEVFLRTAGAQLPDDRLQDALGAARVRAFAQSSRLASALDPLTVGEGTRLALASLPGCGADGAAAVEIVGALAVFVASVVRRRRGDAPVAPEPGAGHVEDFLRMLHGTVPEPRAVEALTAYLVTVMEHGMNASTFTARVIASTRADLVSAVVGAYAALTGPLHGGAPEPVLDMLERIGSAERAQAWIEAALERGERIMGFGHRLYRVRDPRADVLKATLSRLGGHGPRLELAQSVEAAALKALARHKPGRRLETNVEFYTALLLDALGIPRDAFTPVFALGRVVGWTAHAIEQQRTGRLIRPASDYVGAQPPC